MGEFIGLGVVAWGVVLFWRQFVLPDNIQLALCMWTGAMIGPYLAYLDEKRKIK